MKLGGNPGLACARGSVEHDDFAERAQCGHGCLCGLPLALRLSEGLGIDAVQLLLLIEELKRAACRVQSRSAIKDVAIGGLSLFVPTVGHSRIDMPGHWPPLGE